MPNKPSVSPQSVSTSSVNFTVEPEVWWMMTSLEIEGIQALYQDMLGETLFRGARSVKGWVPYMFPNAGPLLDGEKEKSRLDLPQHGTGRRNPWELTELLQDEWIIKQRFDFGKSEWYPYEWSVINTTEAIRSWVNIIHDIHNHGVKSMPISTGLHPYFRVPESDKSAIKWEFEWGKKVAETVEEWSDDWTVTFENPHPEKPFSVIIPGLGRLELTASKDYKKFWVWSLKDKDFVCIEPVMWDEWAIVNSPVIIKPGHTNRNSLKIELFQD